MAKKPSEECKRLSDCDKIDELRKEIYKSPCDILEEAKNSDLCVKYQPEEPLQKLVRIGPYIDPDSPDNLIDIMSELGFWSSLELYGVGL